MNLILEKLLLTSLFAAPLFASESFGGIGVSIYQVHEGAKVAEVIPGTPAAETKLQAGDVIVAVDGESLNGKSIENSKEKLRGQKNKPIEITFVSNNDTLSATLRRTQITVKDLDSDRVEAWYGYRSEFNAQELETYASATESSKQLVAVLQNGKLVKSNAPVAANLLNGVYIDRVDEFVPKGNSQRVNKPSSATLKSVTRASISFDLKSAGKTVISILNADGAVVAKLFKENATVGYNSLNWTSENIPDGRYMVTIEHDGLISGKYVLLK